MMKLKKGDPVWVLPQGFGVVDEAIPYGIGEPIVFEQFGNTESWGTYRVTMTEGDYQGETISWPDIQVYHIDEAIKRTDKEFAYTDARNKEEDRFVASIGGTVERKATMTTINFLPGMDTDDEGYSEMWEEKKQAYLSHMDHWNSEYNKRGLDEKI